MKWYRYTNGMVRVVPRVGLWSRWRYAVVPRMIHGACLWGLVWIGVPNLAVGLGLADTEPTPRKTSEKIPEQSTPARSKLPLAEPVVAANAIIKADRAVSWTQGQSRVLLLERGVSVSVGTYGFRAKRAVVRIDVEPHPGRPIYHLMMYLDDAQPLHDQGPVQAQASRLLVTASTTGRIRLVTDLLTRRNEAVVTPFIQDATDRIERHLAAITAAPLNIPEGQPLFGDQTNHRRVARRQQIGEDILRRARPSETVARVSSVEQKPETSSGLPDRRIMPAGGTVSFHADKVILQRGDTPDTQSTLALIGNVRVFYQNPNPQQGMSLRAENAVIFLSPKAMGQLSGRSTSAGGVLGVYLEDNVVVTDGEYTVRAPRVFYDLERNKAVLLDAVFYSWDVNHNIPIYIRARKLRQESLTNWSAQQAALTTSEFAEPHFSIAAGRLTFGRQTKREGSTHYRFVARDSTMRWGKFPVFYWPYLSGTVGTLKEMSAPRVSAGFSRQNGVFVKTTWDLFSLAGEPRPEGVRLHGRLDFLGDRGPATGLNLRYNLPRMFGYLDGYVLLQDHGEDKIDSRVDVEFDGNTRGYALWRHRQYLRDHWNLSVEASHVSDETFLEDFFQNQAELSKPYETSIYLDKKENNRAFTFLIQQDTTGFTPQITTLQAPGYTVEKAPEIGYYRSGISVWNDRLTYTSETRLSRLRINAGKDTPADRGFTTAQSLQLFGIAPLTSFKSANRIAGVPGSYRLRLDSRHEIQSPLKMGVLDLVPFVSGRVTLYDDDFEEFSGEDDRLRLWTTLGVRAHTQFSKTFNHVENGVLDLYRLRHVVEPYMDLFWSGSTINPEDIPVYDTDVEALHKGFGMRVGVRNTLQTKRGGPGRWRSVDWLTLSTDFVLRSDDTDVNTDVARFFSYRPEYSLGGDHFHTEMIWMVSDTLATVGELTYSFENDLVPLWRLGISLDHSPRLRFFTDYSEIDVLSSQLLTYGFDYELTRKYHVGYRHTLDLGNDESRSIEITLERKLPRWRMLVVARFDELDDETTIGLVLVPEGVGSSRFIQPAGTRRER